MLKSPLYLITDHLLPTLRVLEAKKLREQGMSQTRIASLLGVTQPAVKQYLEENEQEYKEKLIQMGLNKEEIDEMLCSLTEVLTREGVKSAMLFITTRSLIFLSNLRFCKFHRGMDREIPADCAICGEIYRQDEETIFYDALKIIQNPLISFLIPQVLSNLAFAKRGAKDYNDILGIPGRIANIRGVPIAASKPQWGGSKHLSEILIRIMDNCPDVRSVMDIKYDSKVESSIRANGLSFSKVGPQDSVDDKMIAEAVSSVFNCKEDAVIHLGGKGLEPVTYIFGRNPLEVAEKVLKIARSYASS
jgi:predicted fused transcriptional regulator/phosphomethylpyrimidine kinase/predicted transcriptional regulator